MFQTKIHPHKSCCTNRLRWITIFACMCALMKASANQLDLFLGTKNPTACQVYGYASICGYGGNLFFVMLFLWLRQASVHAHPTLKILSGTKFLTLFSRLLLILLLLAFVVLFVLNFVTVQVTPSPYGCIFSDLGQVSQSTRSAAGLVFTAFFQPALALLLLYPFLKQLPKHNRPMPRQSKIRNVIRRSLITLCVIIITDVGTLVASFLLQFKPCIWISSVYDVNSLVGVLSIICANADWRFRLGLSKCTSESSNEIVVFSL